MRPLSQTGLPRVRLSPLQRNFTEGGLRELRRGTLDAANERMEDRILHPTKGWRKLNRKRSLASGLVYNIREGGSADLAHMRRILVEGF